LQQFPYKPKSYAIISQIDETFRLVVVQSVFANMNSADARTIAQLEFDLAHQRLDL